MLSALLDSSGGFFTSQAMAGATSALVNVTSANTTVGTITTSPVTISGGTNNGVTQFTPKAQGTTLISASTPPGFTTPSQFASLNATAALPKITLDSGLPVSNNLQAQLMIFRSIPAPPALTLSLTV